ncbi:hypothetical protein R1flu_005773 [Riccia fluitans]|uniref:Uncharacterized protein n=1 Tax=Riccia fluitans TaxID=41844 RepID=A0ABD1YU43_9MARC
MTYAQKRVNIPIGTAIRQAKDMTIVQTRTTEENSRKRRNLQESLDTLTMIDERLKNMVVNYETKHQPGGEDCKFKASTTENQGTASTSEPSSRTQYNSPHVRARTGFNRRLTNGFRVNRSSTLAIRSSGRHSGLISV